MASVDGILDDTFLSSELSRLTLRDITSTSHLYQSQDHPSDLKTAKYSISKGFLLFCTLFFASSSRGPSVLIIKAYTRAPKACSILNQTRLFIQMEMVCTSYRQEPRQPYPARWPAHCLVLGSPTCMNVNILRT